jgi:hypothetical protein
MEMIWYGILSVAAVVIGIALRFGVYTVLVKNSGWLPEKATKTANWSSGIIVLIALVALLGNAVISGTSAH